MEVAGGVEARVVLTKSTRANSIHQRPSRGLGQGAAVIWSAPPPMSIHNHGVLLLPPPPSSPSVFVPRNWFIIQSDACFTMCIYHDTVSGVKHVALGGHHLCNVLQQPCIHIRWARARAKKFSFCLRGGGERVEVDAFEPQGIGVEQSSHELCFSSIDFASLVSRLG